MTEGSPQCDLRLLYAGLRHASCDDLFDRLGQAGFRLEIRWADSKQEFLEAMEWAPELVLAAAGSGSLPLPKMLRHLAAARVRPALVALCDRASEKLVISLAGRASGDCVCWDELTRFPLAAANALERRRLSLDNGELTRSLRENREEGERARQELRNAHHFSETLIDSVHIGIIVYDRELRFRLWNRFMESLTGLRAADVLGKGVVDVFPDVVESGVLDLLRRALTGESLVSGDMSYTVPSTGKSGWLMRVYSPHTSVAGEIIGVVGAIHDVSKRRQTEVELRQAEEQYRNLVERLPAAVYIRECIGTGKCLYASPQIEPISGYSPAEWLADPRLWLHLIHPDDRSQVLSEIALCVASGQALNCEYRLRHKDDRVIWVRDEAVVGPDFLTGESQLRGLLYDITERKLLEEQLNQSQKVEAIGRLAGGVAHDFNNLLTVISGYNDLTLESLAPSDYRRKYAEDVRKAAERAASLTHQLLAFSRRQVLQPTVINLNDLVLDMESMVRRLIGEHIELATLRSEDLGGVKADRSQIEQVLLNLAVNARDAMPQGGTLTVRTMNERIETDSVRNRSLPAGSYVTLSVSDTGSGMDASTLAHLFEPFFTTKPQGQGTGLGLATCHGIVEQSGGHIIVESHLGEGSTIKIYLPRIGQCSPVRTKLSDCKEAHGGTETLLLAEDEPAVRDLSSLVLKDLGYDVLVASDGQDALRIIEQAGDRKIHLLVSDVIMPRLGGFELAAALRERFPELKILFISGYTDNFSLRNGVFNEETSFLQKPFSPMALARKVRDVLDG